MKDRKSILLVDDEELYLDALAMILIKEGYDISTACNGKKALQSVKKKQYDLVITDMIMPDITGIDVLKEVKSLYPEAKVIIITGFGAPESYLESMTLGAFEYLNKPINMPELKKAIKRAFPDPENS